MTEIKGSFPELTTGFIVFKAAGDLSRMDAIQLLYDKIIKSAGRIDVLVNNAAIFFPTRLGDVTEDQWDSLFTLNLKAPFFLSQLAGRQMQKNGCGKIINIGSMTSIFGGANVAPYSASKGGIVQLSRSLACAWAQENIQVNAILPGFIDTELTQQARIDIPGLNEKVIARTPNGRWGETQELQGAAIFLGSRASDFVTGIALPVDGGFSSNIL